MTTLGDIRNQLSQLMGAVKRQGYKLEDVLPEEMQDHFHDMKDLKMARAYIKEAEGREQQLKEEKISLAATVKAKQAEIDDLPDDFKALKVDLQQAQRSIDYYKELADDANERAARDQRKLAEAIKHQASANEDCRKIGSLERELVDRQNTVFKLLEQNRRTVGLHEAEREADRQIVNEKEGKITALINLSNRLEMEKMEANEASESISETYDTLLAALEAESLDAGELVNQHYVRIRSNEQLFAAISTELTPLNNFYNNTFVILGIYQSLLQDLADPSCGVPLDMPKDLEATLDAACDNLEGLQALSTAIKLEGLAQETVRNQVDNMAKSAGQIYTSLDRIMRDIMTFVDRMRCDTDVWVAVKGQPGKLGKPYTSPASSVSSFASISKRLFS